MAKLPNNGRGEFVYMATVDINMIVATAILLLTFIGIFTEQFHGIHRAKFAMAGAGTIIIAGQYLGFYTPEEATASIDWNVVFLLAIMMIFVSIMMTTGGFKHIAHVLGSKAQGNQFKLMTTLGITITVLSSLLDNVTTVIIFGPLIVVICQTAKVSAVPYLFAAAILSNTGGVATLVGDPPNMMIGSAARIDFITFFSHMIWPVMFSWLGILVMLRWSFRHALAQPFEANIDVNDHIKNGRLWRNSLVVLTIMVGLFILHSQLQWPPWLVAAFGLTLLVFITPKIDLEQVTQHIETPLLMFFIALFILIGGVEASGLLSLIGQNLSPIIQSEPLFAALCLLWCSAILSALIDNIPFTAAMIPILLSLESQGINVSVMWWALALGVGLGGNGTHIGSTANVFVVTLSEKLAKSQNENSGLPTQLITPVVWLKRGLPTMIIGVSIASVFIVLGYDVLLIPSQG